MRINKDWLYDKHLEHLVDTEDISEMLESAARDVVIICGRKGVYEEDIPLDDDGYFKPAPLVEIATYCSYVKILPAFWGGGMGDAVEDIYEKKLQYYEMKLKDSINELTKNQIIYEEPTEIDYIRQVAYC